MQSRLARPAPGEGALHATPAVTPWATCSHRPTPAPEPGLHLLGTAVKLENTYLAIMSKHVSVSSRWRFLKLSSAWAMEFSSADPKLAPVRDVWILLGEGIAARSGHGAGPSSTPRGQSSRHAYAERAALRRTPSGHGTSGATAQQTKWTYHPRPGVGAQGRDLGLLVGAAA